MSRHYSILIIICFLVGGCGGGGGGATAPQQPNVGSGSGGGSSQTPSDFSFTSSSEFSACESDAVLAAITADVSGLSWALSGEDADSFVISSSGNISWRADSSVASADGDAVFEITITGSKSGYNDNSLDVTISVAGAIAFTLVPESPLNNSVITTDSGLLRSTGYVTSEDPLQISDLSHLTVNGELATLVLTEDGDLFWDVSFTTDLSVDIEASASCGVATATYSLRRPEEYSYGVELIVDGRFYGLGSNRESGDRVFVIGDLESQSKEVLAFTEEAEKYGWFARSITDTSYGAGLYDGAVVLADGYRTATSNSGSVNAGNTYVRRGLAIRADGKVIDKDGSVYSWIEDPIFRVEDPEKDFLVRQTAASRCWAWARVYSNDIMLLDSGFVETPEDCAREVGLNSRTAEVEFFDAQSIARFGGSAATVQVGDNDYYPFHDGTKLKGQSFGDGEVVELLDSSAAPYPDSVAAELHISPDATSLLTTSARGKIVRTQLETGDYEVLLNGVGPQTGGFIGSDSHALHQGKSLLATSHNTSFECDQDLNQHFTIVSFKTSESVSRPPSGTFLPCRERNFTPTVFDKDGETLLFTSGAELLEYNLSSKTLNIPYPFTSSWSDDERARSYVVGDVSGDLFVLSNKNLWVHNRSSQDTVRYPLENFYLANQNGPYSLHLDEERGQAFVQARNRVFQFDLSDLDAEPSLVYENSSYLPRVVTWKERPGKLWVSDDNSGFGVLDLETGTLETEDFPPMINSLPQQLTKSGLFVMSGLTYFDPKTKSIIYARN